MKMQELEDKATKYEEDAEGLGSQEVQRGQMWTCARDVIANIERVISGTSDLADVTSHETFGVMDEHVTGPTKKVASCSL